jgi:hypothetical protein
VRLENKLSLIESGRIQIPSGVEIPNFLLNRDEEEELIDAVSTNTALPTFVYPIPPPASMQ